MIKTPFLPEVGNTSKAFFVSLHQRQLLFTFGGRAESALKINFIYILFLCLSK